MLSAVLRHSGCVGFQLLGSGWEGLLWGAAGALGRGCPACPLPPAAEVFLLVVSRRQRPKAAAVGCSGQGLRSSILLWFPEGCRALLPGDLRWSRTPPGSHPSAGVLGPLL